MGARRKVRPKEIARPAITLAELLKRPMPQKLGRPKGGEPAITGWCCNTYHLDHGIPGDCVWQAWRDSVWQYREPEMKHGSGTHQPMYATREDALVALAHELWEKTRGQFDMIVSMF